MVDGPLHQLPATVLARLIADRQVSSRELLGALVRRVDALDGTVNAVVTLDLERAWSSAARADAVTASGRDLPPLHGIPLTVKDALAVAGMRSTCGARELSDHVPNSDADVVALVRAAGAYPFGKTNVPRWASDVQTFNSLFGTTNNPWDSTRTCGGSSGGSAAAVALGFTPFEIGSDIAGSLRIPAAFCGVMTHKPSFGLVPGGGYIDRIEYGWTDADINVLGPMARSVDDLELVLDLIAQPRPDRAGAIRHILPPARHARLDDHRIAVWTDSDACPASGEIVAAVASVAEILRELGASTDVDARPDVDAADAVRLGTWLIMNAIPSEVADESGPLSPEHPWAATHQSWLEADIARARVRAQWAAFFGKVDALVCPVVIRAAFHHDRTGVVQDRRVLVDRVVRPHHDLLWWCVLTGMAYLPSTVIPVGLTTDGLPLGVQIVGPYLEDRTPLAIARAVSEAMGPFPTPQDQPHVSPATIEPR